MSADLRAWRWLETLPRLPLSVGRARHDGQVRVRLCPWQGVGMTLTSVSVEHPAAEGRRFTGTGNTLSEAVARVHDALWRAGIRESSPSLHPLDHAPRADPAAVADTSVASTSHPLCTCTPLDFPAQDCPVHDWNARFEELAAAFYAETGMMAPGKDAPAALGDTHNERQARWDEWLDERGIA